MIDAHHHLFDVTRRDYPWMDGPWADPIRRTFTPDELRSAAIGHGVTRSVAVQAVHTLEETRWLLEVAAREPRIAGVVGWVDLTDPDVAATLASLRAGPGGEFLVGIRHQVHDEPDPGWLLREDVLAGLGAVADAGLAYDLLLRPREMPAAIEAVARLPRLRFVVDHLAKPEIAAGTVEPWRRLLAALARYRNVYCKISGLITEASWTEWTTGQLRPYIADALEVFGSNRLLFGSDWPVCLLAGSYSDVVAAAMSSLDMLTEQERAGVFGGNASRAYLLSA